MIRPWRVNCFFHVSCSVYHSTTARTVNDTLTQHADIQLAQARPTWEPVHDTEYESEFHSQAHSIQNNLNGLGHHSYLRFTKIIDIKAYHMSSFITPYHNAIQSII